jgi:hypothetical protein
MFADNGYNFGMSLQDFLRLLADTPRDKHPALMMWFSCQAKASDEKNIPSRRTRVQRKPLAIKKAQG